MQSKANELRTSPKRLGPVWRWEYRDTVRYFDSIGIDAPP